jgi:hypothetical protein
VSFWTAFGQLLPLIVGTMISPLPIAVVVAMLVTPDGQRNGTAFCAAFMTVTAVEAAAILVLATAAGDSGGGRRGIGVVPLGVGLLFVALAFRSWRGRPREGAAAGSPKWMDAVEGFTALKAAGLGATLAGTGLKNLSLVASAGVVITTASLPNWQSVVLAVAFVVLGCLGVSGPVFFLVVRGAEGAALTLQSWRSFLVAHNAVIMMVLFSVLAATNLADGLGDVLR